MTKKSKYTFKIEDELGRSITLVTQHLRAHRLAI